MLELAVNGERLSKCSSCYLIKSLCNSEYSASRNSYDTPESEEEESNPDPYPLEGKYKDEEDKQWSASFYRVIHILYPTG